MKIPISLLRKLCIRSNLLRRYAFLLEPNRKGAFNDLGYSNIFTTEFELPNQHSKITTEPHIDFVIFTSDNPYIRHRVFQKKTNSKIQEQCKEIRVNH